MAVRIEDWNRRARRNAKMTTVSVTIMRETDGSFIVRSRDGVCMRRLPKIEVDVEWRQGERAFFTMRESVAISHGLI